MKKFFAVLSISIVFFSGLFFLTAVIHEYRPEPVEILKAEGKATYEKVGEKVRVMTWNIGYGGLGKNADFFMDGGVSSKSESRKTVQKNMDGILESFLSSESSILMFQEVDRNSDRSFKIDQFKLLKSALHEIELVFAANYYAFMVPVPVQDPMGKVLSGLVTASKFRAFKAERHSLPSVALWPDKLFHLKRCMLVSRYLKNNGKELVEINIHLSAYDDGKIRNEQMKKLRELAVSEYEKGNTVVIGGDWNQRMPGVTKEQFGRYTTDESYLVWAQKVDKNWKPKEWKWVYDRKVPTVRSNESAYTKGVNFTTVVDGFLVSPDVEIVEVSTVDLGFEFSDHNPVIMEMNISER